jgi:DNA repair protein RecN (Recombination protein N)
MLRSLSIRNVVLIDKLDLRFEGGLCVLTGETGSGKSILLDALGLAIGFRADADLVASGAGQSSVAAEFEIDADHAAHAILKDQGLDDDDILVLRRILNERGRSRAFVNDQPISVALLRRLGETLVEVHGQFETHGLLDPATHVRFVDTYGRHLALTADVANAWDAWRAVRTALAEAEEAQRRARADEEFLRHAADELARADPRLGEEETLASSRTMLMHGEAILATMNEAMADLAKNGGVELSLRLALQKLERAKDKVPGRLDSAIGSLERALIEANEGVAELERASAGLDIDPAGLERAEERLFELRRLARKHGVSVDGLVEFRADIDRRLAGIDDGGAALTRLVKEVDAARAAYVAVAKKLSAARDVAGDKLRIAVEKELPALMLGSARFRVALAPAEEADWGLLGMERVVFEVQTNPNTAAGPINRIASGGELSRIMLGLKVALAESDSVPTLVFDEVDAGVGGAAAAAVGDRLARLGGVVQVLVVTHSPQVAARGVQHLRIAKKAEKGADGIANRTDVVQLPMDERAEEIARMLAGAQVTAEARAAALSLLATPTPPKSPGTKPKKERAAS